MSEVVLIDGQGADRVIAALEAIDSRNAARIRRWELRKIAANLVIVVSLGVVLAWYFHDQLEQLQGSQIDMWHQMDRVSGASALER